MSLDPIKAGHNVVIFCRLNIALIVLSAVANAALADSYEVILGRGVEVCEAYKANLNSAHYSYPMACEREINRNLPHFNQPEWRELNAWDNRELIIELSKFLSPAAKAIDANREYWLKTLKRNIENGHVRLYVTKVDIDNDGKLDNVLKYQDGKCQMAHRYATPIVVLDNTGKHLDKQKTLPLLQNESMNRARNPAGGWGYAMYDVFLYRNGVHFDKWSDFHTDKGFLHVYKDVRGQTKEVCTYKYRR